MAACFGAPRWIPLLAEKLWSDGISFSEPFNFGPHPEDARCVEWVVQKIVSLWGDDASWSTVSDDVHETKSLHLDITKAMTKLEWKPTWKLELTLQSILTWHKAI